MLFKPKQHCEQQEKTNIRTSNLSHLLWKKIFIRIPYIAEFLEISQLIMKKCL